VSCRSKRARHDSEENQQGSPPSLLLPALNSAKAKARTTKCINNLRQMGIASTMYADENKYYPPGVISGVTQWDLAISPYLGSAGEVTLTNAEMRSLIFLCPSAKVTGSDRALNYSANPNVCKDYNFSLLIRADTVPRPSETILSADGIQYKDKWRFARHLLGVEKRSGPGHFLQ